MKKFCLGGLLLLANTIVVAQEDAKSHFSWNAYVEGYYSYDFSKPANNSRPSFMYNFARSNEFNVNLGYVKGSYATDRVRANLAFGAGTYMNANYAAEQGVLKNIFEANAGFKVFKNKNLWFDIGILPSHIGFESAIGKDCWNLTRSILADNTPFFEAGGRLSYNTDNGKFLFSVLALNGWQRITRVEGNSLMSWGTQIQYKPNDRFLLNYSTFIGTDKPDSARLMRIYHNLYGVFSLTSKLGLTLGLDIGTEDKTASGDGVNTLYSPVGILKYSVNDQWALAARVEYYNDEKGIIIATGTPNGFQTSGYSLNIDYAPAKNVLVRLEGRLFNSKDAIFTDDAKAATNNNTAVTFSTALSF